MKSGHLHNVHYQCQRFDCLYHAAKFAYNGCDYCLIEGHSRDCETGDNCTKYKFATSEERKALSIQRYTHESECSLYEAYGSQYDLIKITEYMKL